MILFCTSCQNNDFLLVPELTLSDTELTFSSEGGQQELTITSNTTWEITNLPNWCTVSKNHGDNIQTIMIIALKNQSYDDRQAILSVQAGNLSQAVNITQQQKDTIIATNEYNISAKGGIINILIQHNINYNISIPAEYAEWIKRIETKSLTTSGLSFSISPNKTDTAREGYIILNASHQAVSDTVYIHQAPKAIVLISQTTFDVKPEGDVITVDFQSNIDFTSHIPDIYTNWIKESQTKAISSTTKTFTIALNNTFENREGFIVVSALKDHLPKDTIRITQRAKEIFEVKCDKTTVSYKGDVIHVTVTGNLHYQVDIPQETSWITENTIDTKRTIQPICHTFNIEANTKLESRSGKIHFVYQTHTGEQIETIIIEQSHEEIAEIPDKTLIEIPDVNFKLFLIKKFDTDGDGEISIKEASVIEDINCEHRSIQSLEGIQYCTSLKTLNCSGNALKSLDLSRCTTLQSLNCSFNYSLGSLNVRGCTSLKTLNCSNNSIIDLNISDCIALQSLKCTSNRLTYLNTSDCIMLQSLECNSNRLTDLNTNNCTALATLNCTGNQLTSLDLRGYPALKSIYCDNNLLTSLYLGPMIETVICSDNLLTKLDISGCTALATLICSSNRLLKSLDLSQNTALASLRCEYTQLTSLDLSQNTKLINLYCSNNQLTNLDLSKNTALKFCECFSNQLQSLDLCPNATFVQLICYSNQLTSLDLSQVNKIVILDCSSNAQLTTIWLKQGQFIDGLTKDPHTNVEYKE